MSLTPQQKSNLVAICDAAERSALVSGIPAAFTAAQCILESNWLRVRPGNNCFGVKSYVGEFGRQLLLTREWFNDKELAWFLHLGDSRSASLVDPTIPPNVAGRRQYHVYDWFATFAELSDCFTKRAQLFRYGQYAPLQMVYLADNNLEAYISGIAKIYATAPNYAQVVMSIIRMPEVQDALFNAHEAVGQVKV